MNNEELMALLRATLPPGPPERGCPVEDEIWAFWRHALVLRLETMDEGARDRHAAVERLRGALEPNDAHRANDNLEEWVQTFLEADWLRDEHLTHPDDGTSADEMRQNLHLSSTTANAIVNYRLQHGDYTSVDQLLQVVSKTIYDKIKDLVTVG